MTSEEEANEAPSHRSMVIYCITCGSRGHPTVSLVQASDTVMFLRLMKLPDAKTW